MAEKRNKKYAAGREPATPGNANDRRKIPVQKPSLLDTPSRILPLILLLVTFVVFFNTIFNDYSVDDHYVVVGNEQTYKGFSGLPEIFRTHFVTFKGIGASYRATARASFAVEYGLFGENPHASHFFNVLFYMLLVYVVFRFLLLVFGPDKIFLVFCAMLIYAVHPIHVEVVASLKSRDELFSSLFSFTSCLLFVRYVKENKGHVWLVLSSLFFFLALMSKESSQQFLAVAPLAAFIVGSRNWKKIALSTSALLFTSVAFWLFLSYGLPNTKLLWMSAVSEGYPYIEHPLAFVQDPSERYGTAFYGLLYYVRNMFFPFPLSFFYGINLIPIVEISHPVSIISIILYTSAGILALYLLKRRHVLSFAILYIVITLSMFSNLLIKVSGIIADRYAFSASLGFCIIIAWLVIRAFKIPANLSIKDVPARKAFLTVLMIIVLAFAAKSVQRNHEWRNPTALSKADAARNPESAVVNLYYAKELFSALEDPGSDSALLVPEVMTYFQKVLEIDSNEAFSHLRLAQLHWSYYNDLRKAEAHLKRSIEIHNTPEARYYDKVSKYFYLLLANLYREEGDTARQMQVIDMLNKVSPDTYEPYFLYGFRAWLKGEYPFALQQFEKGIRAGGKNKEVYDILLQHYRTNGMMAEIDTLNYYMDKPLPPPVEN